MYSHYYLMSMLSFLYMSQCLTGKKMIFPVRICEKYIDQKIDY